MNALPKLFTPVILPLEIDFTPAPAVTNTDNKTNPFDELETEIKKLRARITRTEEENSLMKREIHSIYSTPVQKRHLLKQLEDRHNISRRRACRLLTLARSTCWYRPAGTPIIEPKFEEPIAKLPTQAVINRLKKISKQEQNGQLVNIDCAQIQFACGLKRLGLPRAAELATINLRLAMDIFSAWCDMQSQFKS